MLAYLGGQIGKGGTLRTPSTTVTG
jgi:hypothetical protein